MEGAIISVEKRLIRWGEALVEVELRSAGLCGSFSSSSFTPHDLTTLTSRWGCGSTSLQLCSARLVSGVLEPDRRFLTIIVRRRIIFVRASVLEVSSEKRRAEMCEHRSQLAAMIGQCGSSQMFLHD